MERIQFSSDGQGSMPIFNGKREYVGLAIGLVKSLYREVKDAVLKDGVDFETALKVITSNVADNLKLSSKGRIAEDFDADLVLVNKDSLEISDVFSKGREMYVEGKLIVKGTFEK